MNKNVLEAASILYTGLDGTKRSWVITYRLEDGQLTVRFICWRSSGASKALDQTCAWGTEGWDISRPWLPRSPAPMAWPELPDCPEEWRAEDCADTEYVGGLRVGYRYARQKLAAMNPNYQPKNHQ
jgi:hypothetical protein